MVFSGRPSTACHACRTKRLKCDRVQTGCTQCLRKRIQCPGYRDPSAMRLRDETGRVTRKARGASRWQPSASSSPKSTASPTTSSSQTSSPSHTPSSQTSSPSSSIVPYPPQSLPQAASDVAVIYFMSSYIKSSAFEGYLPQMYAADPSAHDALTSAVTAASLATFGRAVRGPRYVDVARHEYALALSQTNACLAVPEKAVLDSTLAAVLVLGLFEAVVFPGGQSPTSWTAHTLGAMELLQLRGARRFESDVSRQLLAQASNNIRTSCIQRSIAVPAAFRAFSDETWQSLDPRDLVVKLAPLVNKVADLKARSSTAGDPSLLHAALNLDRQVVSFTEQLEPYVLYTVQQDANAPWAYRNTVYLYPSVRIARFWNSIRMLRAFLIAYIAEGIAGATDAGQSDYVASLGAYAKENMADVAAQVLSSVPAFMELDEPGGRFSPPARTLVWPLSIVQMSDLCSEEAKGRASACLEKLAGDLNMPQAVYAAKDPGSKDDWLHLSHLT